MIRFERFWAIQVGDFCCGLVSKVGLGLVVGFFGFVGSGLKHSNSNLFDTGTKKVNPCWTRHTVENKHGL